MSPTNQEISEKASPIFRKYGLAKVALFGSRARGTARIDSDIDLLYKLDNSTGVFQKFDAQQELEKTLGAPVDLVADMSVVARMRPYIKKDLQVIYEG
jgi:predicted nucleotidyltransferase